MRLRYLFIIFSAIISSAALHAEATLPCMFLDHMVLQERERVPIWGSASVGEQITVTLDDRHGTAQVDTSGNWQVNLDLHDKSGGPYELIVQGKNRIVLQDVLVGEVWVAGGQSNMEFTLDRSTGGKEEIAQSENSQLRQFKVAQAGSLQALNTCKGQWVSAGPETSGQFTAVGYYYAKILQASLQKPVALISSYYGGSSIEAWMSHDALNKLPELEAQTAPKIQDAKAYPAKMAQYRDAYQAWQQKYHREDVPKDKRNKFANSNDAASADWKKIENKGSLSDSALKDGGVLWLRAAVNVRPELVGMYLPLHLGTLKEFDQVFWNGVQIGSTTADASTTFNDQGSFTTSRRYDVPANLVKEGPATLTIRIFNPVSFPALEGMRLSDGSGMLGSGTWWERVESAEPPLDSAAKKSFPQRPAFLPPNSVTPTALFHGMITPLMPYVIRGVIWFQGEANEARAFQYRASFSTMIQDWRKQWGEGDFPFYFCQLANFMAKDAAPRESGLAELREAQSMALALPKTGQAITLDLGEEADIHFRNKKTVGQRLARIALAKTYGYPVSYSGPVYDSSRVDGSSIRIRFQHVEDGLKATTIPAAYKRTSTMTTSVPLVRNSPKSQLEGFQICGADHKWVWADAHIDKSTVLVSAPGISKPVAVRYAWGNNPTVNLYNSVDLPAAPFRTDDFEISTQNSHF